jgi:hypothetical protein
MPRQTLYQRNSKLSGSLVRLRQLSASPTLLWAQPTNHLVEFQP